MKHIRLSHTKYIFLTNETVLDKHNKMHQALIERMDRALQEIWKYSKSGNATARDFMQSKTRYRLVQFQLDFQNTDIPEINQRATYRAYKDIMAEVMPLLHNLNKDKQAHDREYILTGANVTKVHI